MTTDRERFARAKELFTAALDRAEADRDRFLAEACRDDPRLLDDVLALLAQHSLDGQHFEPPAWHEPAAVPERIGPYRVLSLVGEGGMGVVYRARPADDPGAPDIALKVLRRGALDPQFERRLQREAEILRRLDHPGIARLLAAGNADGAPYLAMEFVTGVSLAHWRVEQDPPLRERVRLLADLCEAVDAAHARGVVHRDLKPENILVTADGRPRVLDFGIARLVDAEAPAQTLMTQTWQLLGTVRYMSPEQASGSPGDIDARTDVYALGVIGCELLTGRLPYDLSRLSTPRALLEITTAEPRNLAGLLPAPFGPLEQVLLHALEKKPSDRYATAADLAADLRHVLAGRAPALRRPPLLARLGRQWRLRPRARRFVMWLTIVATAAGLAAALTWPARWRPALTWDRLYAELEEADRLRHRNAPSRADLQAAVAAFERARTDLAQLPARPYSPDLHRYVKWRLGELHYFLGSRAHDADELELARGYWQDARVSTLTRGAALGIDSLAVVRPRILRLGIHHPSTGVGYAMSSLAELRAPATNWHESTLAQDSARYLCGQGLANYHTADIHAAEGAADLTSTLLDLGGSLAAEGAVLDSLSLVQRGLDTLRVAAGRGTIRSAEGRATLRRALGRAFLDMYRLGAGAAALDSAAIQFDVSRDLCDPSLGRGYWQLYRGRGEVALARAAAAADADERRRALRQARQEFLASGTFLQADVDDIERAGTEADLAWVEASLATALTEPARFVAADSLLAAAERRLDPGRQAVPWAECEWRRAQVAAARWRATGDATARIAAQTAIARVRTAVPRLEYPSLYRRLDELERELRAKDAGD